jgi:ribonuclease PH
MRTPFIGRCPYPITFDWPSRCNLLRNYQKQAVLDLDYDEDSTAEIDANFILTAAGELVEVQATGEEHPFSRSSLNEMLDLAETGCGQLFALQQRAIQDSGL